MIKPNQEVPIDKEKCDRCIKKLTCNCYASGKKMCPMICIDCGKCLCNPHKKDCCIEGHYLYEGDLIICVECKDMRKI